MLCHSPPLVLCDGCIAVAITEEPYKSRRLMFIVNGKAVERPSSIRFGQSHTKHSMITPALHAPFRLSSMLGRHTIALWYLVYPVSNPQLSGVAQIKESVCICAVICANCDFCSVCRNQVYLRLFVFFLPFFLNLCHGFFCLSLQSLNIWMCEVLEDSN